MDDIPDNVTSITDHRKKKKTNWQDQVEQTRGGKLSVDLSTVTTMIEGQWGDHFYFESFSQKVWVTDEFGFARGKQPIPREFSEHDLLQMTTWVNDEKCKAQTSLVEKAVKQIAHFNVRDHLEEYLEGLEWDKKPRIDTWLTAYLGAEDDYVHRAVGAAWLISAVARGLVHKITDPTVFRQADYMLILEGEQGIGKSTALRILAGEWFSDQMPDLHDKDASIQLEGVWIQEIAELDAMLRARREATAVKAFLTRTADRYRSPYGVNAKTHVRRCVFSGTTNTTDYLSDETGNRRMWPVPVMRANREALQRDRDQLWAEAMHRYRAGEPWHITDISVDLELRKRQADRRPEDAFERIVEEWAAKQESIFFINDVMRDALQMSPRDMTQAQSQRVGKILQRVGYVRRTKRLPNGSTPKGYWHSRMRPIPQ